MHASHRDVLFWLLRAAYAVAIVAAGIWAIREVSEPTLRLGAHAVLVLLGLACLLGGAVVGVFLTWLTARTRR